MISCKICHQKFKKPSKFYEHLHSNKCKIPSMDQNMKNANKMLKLCKNIQHWQTGFVGCD